MSDKKLSRRSFFTGLIGGVAAALVSSGPIDAFKVGLEEIKSAIRMVKFRHSLTQQLARAMALEEDRLFLMGTGAGEPCGYVQSTEDQAG